MTNCQLKDSLQLSPRTAIDFGLRNSEKAPILTVVFSRKNIENKRRWSFRLEQDLGKLPDSLVNMLEKERKDIFSRLNGLQRPEEKVLKEIKRDYRLVAQAPNNGRVIITAYSQRHQTLRIFLRSQDARRFFENI